MTGIDILLVTSPGTSPFSSLINKGYGTVPLGLAYIGSVLMENNYVVKAIDFYHEKSDVKSLGRIIETERPGIVGISVSTETYSNAMRLARRCKEIDREVKVIMGGPHVTFTAEEVLKHDFVDIVVRGEGEFTMLELAGYFLRGYKNLENIQGISYRVRSKVIHNPRRDFILNLDHLAFFTRHLFNHRYAIKGGLLSSRGCPSRCIFCAALAMAGRKYRCRSAEDVMDEIIYLHHQFAENKIQFLDDTLTADINRLHKILDYFEQMKLPEHWSVESRVDVVNEALLKRMAKLGCNRIVYGIESGSQEVLDKIGKGIHLTQVLRAVKWASETGMHVTCSFILGHPFDTPSTVKKTIELALNLQHDFAADVMIGMSTPYPGTSLYRQARKLGLANLEKSFDDYTFLNPVYDTKYFTKAALRNLHFEMMQQLIQNMPEKVLNYYKTKAVSWSQKKTEAS